MSNHTACEPTTVNALPDHHIVPSPFGPGHNAALLLAYLAVRDTALARRSHYFGGRFENVYLPREAIAALGPVLDFAAEQARLLCGLATRPEVGFWFNEMAPGQRTLAHTHDDSDELLSGVYYVKVPPRSGDLLLGEAPGQARVKPAEGLCVFFSPQLVHEVETNASDEVRLSIGMNFGIRAAEAPTGRD